MNGIQRQLSTFNPRKHRLLTIMMGALLWGFAWQIRGNGTSGPSVVILLFLLFVSIHYSPRKKFNVIIFALTILVFAMMRTGWGTFVAQAGIPGVSAGHIVSDVAENARGERFDVVVLWWQGYFWLFIVGVSWAGLPSLLFGGYFFTKFRYTVKDLAIVVILFIIARYIGGYLAERLIPVLAPQYMHEIYLPGVSKRNYQSMRGNLASAMAILPVLLYIYSRFRDNGFVIRSVIVMAIFGTGLSGAAVWHALGRIHAEWGLPFWSLWEYTSGFLIGGQIFWFYSRLPEGELQASDVSPGLEFIDRWNAFGQFIVYGAALYFLFLSGLQESIVGSLRSACVQLDIKPFVPPRTIQIVLLAIALPAYYLYRRGAIGAAWRAQSFREKSAAALAVLLPVNYLLFVLPFAVAGKLSQLNTAAALDTISFAVVETYGIYLFRQLRCALTPADEIS